MSRYRDFDHVCHTKADLYDEYYTAMANAINDWPLTKNIQHLDGETQLVHDLSFDEWILENYSVMTANLFFFRTKEINNMLFHRHVIYDIECEEQAFLFMLRYK